MFATIAVIATLALLVWAAIARPLGAHGQKELYRVRPYDTLWTIASSHYAGDLRDAIWRIERVNRLAGPEIRPGEVLTLP